MRDRAAFIRDEPNDRAGQGEVRLRQWRELLGSALGVIEEQRAARKRNRDGRCLVRSGNLIGADVLRKNLRRDFEAGCPSGLLVMSAVLFSFSLQTNSRSSVSGKSSSGTETVHGFE